MSNSRECVNYSNYLLRRKENSKKRPSWRSNQTTVPQHLDACKGAKNGGQLDSARKDLP